MLLYFSCHGLKDERGQLFFATINTKPDRPNSTAVSARFLAERLEDGHAAAKVVLLDCCYSGAFSKGYVPRGGLPSDPAGQVAGRGSLVLAASGSRGVALEQPRRRSRPDLAVQRGTLIGNVRPEPQPPGRGTFLRRWAEPQMIQAAWLPSRRESQ